MDDQEQVVFDFTEYDQRIETLELRLYPLAASLHAIAQRVSQLEPLVQQWMPPHEQPRDPHYHVQQVTYQHMAAKINQLEHDRDRVHGEHDAELHRLANIIQGLKMDKEELASALGKTNTLADNTVMAQRLRDAQEAAAQIQALNLKLREELQGQKHDKEMAEREVGRLQDIIDRQKLQIENLLADLAKWREDEFHGDAQQATALRLLTGHLSMLAGLTDGPKLEPEYWLKLAQEHPDPPPLRK
jgi:chromosome segregation ATPase